MAALAGTMLVWPNTFLDGLWRLNPQAQRALAPAGRVYGPLFWLFSMVMLAATVGWFRQRVWAWRLAVITFSVHVAGDFVNLLRGDWLRGGLGLIFAGGLLCYLLRSKVREEFKQDGSPSRSS
jgi:hypothetical protein